jgi:hypothetical protein
VHRAAQKVKRYPNGVKELTSEVAIRAFLSYARADDEEFCFVEPLKRKLAALVKVKSGRTLEIFVDRDSIGWGETWRDRLAEEVEAAMIFLPLLSATYLDRPACREEFLAFHSKAQTLGVTDLLLPILLFKSPVFGPDAQDEIAQIAEARQHKCIEDGLMAGPDSSTWLVTMKDLAESLLEAVAKAEASLAALNGDRGSGGGTALGSQGSVDSDETPGLAELMLELEPTVEAMSEAAGRLPRAFDDLGSAVSLDPVPENASAKQYQTWAIRAASRLRAPAAEIESAGKDLFTQIKRFDELLQGFRTIFDQIDDENIRDQLESGYGELLGQFQQIEDVEPTIEELLNSLRPAELMSVPLRKALAPARRGITLIRDSLALIRSWDVSQGPRDRA